MIGEKRPRVLIISGPTGVGKTELSIKLAEKFDGEIISCDSMQIYKDMDIGTAKVGKEERTRVVHHLIDIVEPSDTYSVSQYRKDALKTIGDIVSRKKMPILVGGTGFYIEAVMYEQNYGLTGSDDRIREKYWKYAEEKSSEALYELLLERDPKRAHKLHFNEVKKIVRALEILDLTGKKMSSLKKPKEENSDYDFSLFVLNMDREKLYERINFRVDKMIENGLIEEAKNLYDRGLSKDNQAMKAIGYIEILDYLRGLSNEDEMIRLIKQNSRKYAKRQLTWFRSEKKAQWIDKGNFDEEGFIKMIGEKFERI